MDLELLDCFGRKKKTSYNRRNTVNTKKFTPPTTTPPAEKQDICLASASQAKQKLCAMMMHNQFKFHEVLVIGYLAVANFMNFKAIQE